MVDRLLAHPSFKSFRITALIRAQEKAAALESVGLTPVVGTYQDFALLEKLASESDYVITAVRSVIFVERRRAQHCVYRRTATMYPPMPPY